MLDSLTRLDAWLYRGERAAVAAMLAIMGGVVFLDVVYRVTATSDSKLVPNALEAQLGAAAAPVWLGVCATIVATFAFRTRESSQVLVKALAVGLFLAVGQQIYVNALPSGIVGAQTIALSLTLWMGMAGACLAAFQRRHLALDVGSKLWPPSVAPKVAAVGHFVTAAFCALLVMLGMRSILGYEYEGQHIPGHYDTWADTQHAAGTMTGLPIPKWAVVASIPVGMAVLAFRFALQGVLVWTGREALAGDDTLRQLGIEENVGDKA